VIPVPIFSPKVTLSTRNGIHISDSTSDPPVPPDNGGLNANPFIGANGTYQDYLSGQAALNKVHPLRVNEQGNLVLTYPSGFQIVF